MQVRLAEHIEKPTGMNVSLLVQSVHVFLFFFLSHRTAKDFKMMKDMKKKLNPRNSVSAILYIRQCFPGLHNIKVYPDICV